MRLQLFSSVDADAGADAVADAVDVAAIGAAADVVAAS